MAIHRYAVLDADGVKVNTILVDDASAGKYWPGYGAKLLFEAVVPEEPKALPPPPRPDDFGVLDVVASEPMQTGDQIDFKTGVVTKKKPDPVDAAVADGVIDAR